MFARRGNAIVGRISAARDHEHDRFHGDRVGTFGHFEATDAEAARALLTAARDWLRAHGASVMRGPVDFSTNYRCGLLVGGDPGPPVVTMPHNPLRYAAWLESFGLAKAKDLVALMLTAERLDLSRMDRLVDRVRQRTPVRSRRLDTRRFAAEIQLIWTSYNRIWERNWGFAPMTRDEFLAEAADLKTVLDPALTVVLEREATGEAVAFAIGVPDANVAIRACRGRLLPFGWLRFLRTLRHVHSFRTITLGVVPEVRGTGIDAVLLRQLIAQGLEAGYPVCEASWILEDNVGNAAAPGECRRPLSTDATALERGRADLSARRNALSFRAGNARHGAATRSAMNDNSGTRHAACKSHPRPDPEVFPRDGNA